ncbi:3-hydroxyisobutyrate dehydrogenase [Frankia sp. R43]|uniref:3-hydroxyisobutyrate dehydrogenase n=1 Tax=Frankia sp. R43 TaxID=269536 RepID=UPI0006CA1745|nr:3-hydroxyisobutyrate dehydrogenase [Frankia sp. R43]KPM55440.1 3-hydroxyisobutyrate dehydrogenase [Frankia sp. R43]
MTATVAFLGLGNMGGPMAGNLAKAGYRVVGFDPVPAAADAARTAGLDVTPSGTAAVETADVVLTMLPSGRHVLDAYTDILPHARPGSLFVDCSTIDVGEARAAAKLAADAGHPTCDAPVSGGVVGAQAATLTFMVGADDSAFTAASPLLEAMGRRVVHCGTSGAGQAAKICNNMILGISMIAVSEGFVLAERLGLSAQALFDVASVSSGQCWALNTNCPVPGPVPTSPANRDYTGGFAAGLMLKDLRLAAGAAAAVGANLPLGQHATDLYRAFVEQDGPGRDFSAVITGISAGTLAPANPEETS